ncbi:MULTISPECIES: hypothetical protein [unclassified Mesorhizobium]|uniref:hypothetical protein n=1 Tax=unclassified Mesorhizobium TaxID=325217 RepID=UPI000FCA8293|nr:MULTISPECIES: hypothetical protein [unclassified Mesorhizobium]RUX97255.1 hypothetical protein EN993_04390 [Mesorhizobium sp. M7D.F.Ca.US.004.01.2.1]RVA35051.1 hypothetical protein EN935_05110 [Mesorhizobium sp. M7D.F.Ca.US.004.03.1.1]
MDVRRVVAVWYQGRLVPEESMVSKHFIVLPGERYERHWTSKAAHVLVDFYLEHWKWVIGTMIAVIALTVAILR